MKCHVLNSEDKDLTPWVLLNDCRDWNTALPEASEVVEDTVAWMMVHNCILFSNVFSKKIHTFSADQLFNGQSIVRFSFDYETAHQDCLDVLSKTASNP
ncbi:hypothetical protein L4C34_18700 [Vibrio profundum]|uniref:hypothetical protein n=1 Tax=Vibrio profundum TaxID=2910247 RepID=UPI003D0B8315